MPKVTLLSEAPAGSTALVFCPLRLGPLASPGGHSVPRPCRGGGPSPAWLSGPAVLPSPLQPHHLSLPVLHVLWAGRPCCLSWPVLLQSSPSSYTAPPGWCWRSVSLSPEPQSDTGGGRLRVGGRGPQPVPVVALSKVSIGGPPMRARMQQGRLPRTMGRGGVTVSFTGSLPATARHKSSPVPSQPAWVQSPAWLLDHSVTSPLSVRLFIWKMGITAVPASLARVP